jgi:hypothetical protein
VRRIVVLLLATLAVLPTVAACAGDAPIIATFTRDWGDGRVETLELYDDGKVLMNHVGTIDRATLTSADVDRLKASLADIAPAADPAAYPRLTLAPSGGESVVVDASTGTTGGLFLSLLDTHRLP